MKKVSQTEQILNLNILTDHTAKYHSHKRNVILLITRSLLVERKYYLRCSSSMFIFLPSPYSAYLPNFFNSRYLNGGYVTHANAIDIHEPTSPPIFEAIGP